MKAPISKNPAATQPELPEDLKFPGRSTLYVKEVAEKLDICPRHVISLIEEGKIRAINVAGVNVSDRKSYRIPVSEYERFLKNQTL
jgi:hypothetical protein